MLSRFNVIVAVNRETLGIGNNGTIGWRLPEDLKFFRDTTIGDGKNAVIMGRKTYESIPERFRPLSSRLNIVLSRTTTFPGVVNCTSFEAALQTVKTDHPQIETVYVAGGVDLYTAAVTQYNHLCDRVYITWVSGTYNCDVFFPLADDTLTSMASSTEVLLQKETHSRKVYRLNIRHREYEYLDLLRRVLDAGEDREDRTGVGTKSLFGEKMVFDLSRSFPLITTKKVYWHGLVKELLFFLKGKTDTKELEREGVNIWRENTSETFLKDHNLPWKEGDMGPGYGFQWRHWGAEYQGSGEDYSNKGIDQLTGLIQNMSQNPYDRRHILSAWNVADVGKMALPPCHMFAQFNISTDRKLSCLLYQRSADLFLGVPFNIGSYALLTLMIARILSLRPDRLIHVIGDGHIYKNHLDQVKLQLERTPYAFPTISFTGTQNSLDDFEYEHIKLNDYLHHEAIKGKIAV